MQRRTSALNALLSDNTLYDQGASNVPYRYPYICNLLKYAFIRALSVSDKPRLLQRFGTLCHTKGLKSNSLFMVPFRVHDGADGCG